MYKVVLLLIGSNVFMTIAWYGHLKLKWLEGRPLIVAILVAWGVAFFEYCLQVPANRLGYFGANFSGYQLKIDPGGHHATGLHRLRLARAQGEADLELRRQLRLHAARRVLRDRVQAPAVAPGRPPRAADGALSGNSTVAPGS